ncbi:acyl-CoA dehydrogenase family protein [uncultured Fibrella sp.]|uniref:acyl-CoA dehydrogenase family protein n=1 Tax=uncultured Fibrella sp. TaxID=1284596 RepID=UPI0035C95BE8
MTIEIVENQVDNVQLIRESVRDFAGRHLAPHVREWDDDQHFPADEFRQMGELGLLGMLVPETYGGAGLGYHEYVAAIVELSKVDGAVGLSMAAHNSLCTNHILTFGSEAQKQKYLPKLASGEHIGAWGLTEPNTGSDAGNMRTRAVQQDNGDWLLNGAKNFITHGRSGNVAVVIARTGEPNTPHNATAFVVERGTPGFRGGKKEDKLGMRASETAEMIFEDCRIPDSQRLGGVGEGFVQSLKILDGGRISIAALSLGIAMGAYEAALAYAQERQQFGQSIFNFQGISFKLADMATDIEASRLLIEHASELKNQHKPVTKASAMAKLFASEVSVRVANEAIQIMGGYGYIKDFPVEKFYRDAKLCTIGEGTSEIQKLVIARHLIKSAK